jgi:hypothetical protein
VPSTDQFYDLVRATAAGTPYVVTRTDEGFDVELDLVDATWFAAMYAEGLSKAYKQVVKVDERAGTFTMLDAMQQVEWKAGISGGDHRPRLTGSYEMFQGRIMQKERQKTWAWNTHGDYGSVVDFSYNSAEGHSLIRHAATELGFREKMPAAAKIGLAFAGIAIGGIVLGGIGVLIAWALGAF